MDRLVDVYPYRQEQNGITFLIFKRAADVIYTNQWRMVGGKVKAGERFDEAALRELKEESGLEPLKFWTVPSLNQFYDPAVDNIRQIPTFAAEVDAEESVVLNHEHSTYRWIDKHQIDRYIDWPEQQRLMKMISNILANHEILDEWIINT